MDVDWINANNLGSQSIALENRDLERKYGETYFTMKYVFQQKKQSWR